MKKRLTVLVAVICLFLVLVLVDSFPAPMIKSGENFFAPTAPVNLSNVLLLSPGATAKQTTTMQSGSKTETYQDVLLEARYPVTHHKGVNLDIEAFVNGEMDQIKTGCDEKSKRCADLSSVRITYALSYYAQDILSVQYTINKNFEDHDRNRTKVINQVYNLKTGGKYALSDLFAEDTQYMDKLSELLRQYLAEQDGIDMQESSDLMLPRKCCFNNFALKEDQLVFNLAPAMMPKYNTRALPVAIPLKELEGFFKLGTPSIPTPEPESVAPPKTETPKQEQPKAETPAPPATTPSPLPALPENDGTVKYVALTFDDGPGQFTAELLDGLKQRGVLATFFVLGCQVEKYGDVLKRAAEEGHQIANHTYDHKYLTKLSLEQAQTEIDSTNTLIEQATGVVPRYIRPPGGYQNEAVRQCFSQPFIMWSVDTNDWKYKDAERHANYIASTAVDGDIILMHDIYSTSVQGALKAIDLMQARGYVFVTVDELFRIKGKTTEAGYAYSSAK